MTIEVRIVDAAATREMRRAVLRPTWAAGSPMAGDGETGAVHLAAVDEDGAVVGSAVLLPRPYTLRPEVEGPWQLRGMATAASARGRGIGTALVARAIDEVRTRGGRLVWCDARTEAVAFYRRQGFAVDGPEFEHVETGIPHFPMSRPVSGNLEPGPPRHI